MTLPASAPLVAPSDWFMPLDDDEDDVLQGPGPLIAVAPPLPAPYLVGVPQLSDELLDLLDEPYEEAKEQPAAKSQRLRANLIYNELKRELFVRRHDFQDHQQVLIVSEPARKPKRK